MALIKQLPTELVTELDKFKRENEKVHFAFTGKYSRGDTVRKCEFCSNYSGRQKFVCTRNFSRILDTPADFAVINAKTHEIIWEGTKDDIQYYGDTRQPLDTDIGKALIFAYKKAKGNSFLLKIESDVYNLERVISQQTSKFTVTFNVVLFTCAAVGAFIIVKKSFTYFAKFLWS